MRQVKLLTAVFVALVVLTGFGGCQTPPTPQNIEQSVAYAYPLHATATNTVTELLKQQKVSIESAENALRVSKQVKASLDLALSLSKQGKPTDAQATLKMAMTALEGLQKFVEESKK